MTLPPKPPVRARNVGFIRFVRLFRRDMLSAMPEHLYRAWMACFRTPFFRSYLCNDPALVELILKTRPDDFPKSGRVREGLSPLLGNSVFVTNGEVWKRQRRIIDPAFEGGRLRHAFAGMWAAGQSAAARMPQEGVVEIEAQASHAAADVIFRTLFSVPIEDKLAAQVFSAFHDYQRSQPIVNLAAFIRLPAWVPRYRRRKTRAAARHIRTLITRMTLSRAAAIARADAPDDLATKIMTMEDPHTGARFSSEEMVDQVAIFFLAGHETSASALSWALYLLAMFPKVQERVAQEAQSLPEAADFAVLSKLRVTRNVFREALRLYPPVPMMVRENVHDEVFRGRKIAPGAQIVLSPWYVQRHERLWEGPDAFDPDRWERAENKKSSREAYLPFSAGPRVCPGAGFAMMEGTLLLAQLIKTHRFAPIADDEPRPVAHLTLRAAKGIRLMVTPR